MTRISIHAAVIVAALVLGSSGIAPAAHAQDVGPQAPPPKFEVKRIPSVPHPGPPPIPEQEIIQKFAAHEDEIKKALDTYTFTQTIRMQELTDPGGTFTVSGMVYSRPDGQRSLRVVGQGESTLKLTHFSLEDVREISSIPLFPLTSDEIANYKFIYAGQQSLDQLNTYVFQVKPKTLDRYKRFFEGVIWIDDHDLAIVKSYGKFVNEYSGNGLALPFTMFETYRENFQNKYWFPTYVRSDDSYNLLQDQPPPPKPVGKGTHNNGEISDGTPEKPEAPPPTEEVPLRLIIRCTDFKVQQPGDVPTSPSAADVPTPASTPSASKPVKP
jgi:hypothetical protein